MELFIQHAISGYIAMVPLLLLYFFILLLKGKKPSFAHILLSYIFCFYLIGILAMTGIWWLRSFSPKFVWVPFLDMVRGPIDTALNVLLLIPLGILLPMLYKEYGNIRKTALAGFLISLVVEIVQMFGCGSTDINDLITNTIGACIGYYIYALLYKIIPDSWQKALQVNGVQCYYEPTVYWILSLLVMTTIQLNIFHMLF